MMDIESIDRRAERKYCEARRSRYGVSKQSCCRPEKPSNQFSNPRKRAGGMLYLTERSSTLYVPSVQGLWKPGSRLDAKYAARYSIIIPTTFFVFAPIAAECESFWIYRNNPRANHPSYFAFSFPSLRDFLPRAKYPPFELWRKKKKERQNWYNSWSCWKLLDLWLWRYRALRRRLRSIMILFLIYADETR